MNGYKTNGGVTFAALARVERQCEEALANVRVENSALAEDNSRLRAAMATIKRKSAEMTEAIGARLAQSGEVGVVSLGFGVVQGRFGPVKPLGLPIDGTAAMLLHASGIALTTLAPAKYAGYADHVHNLGDGAFAAFMHNFGAGIGADMLLSKLQQQQQAQRPQAQGAVAAGEQAPAVIGASHTAARAELAQHTRAPMSFEELAVLAAAA